MRTPQVLIFFLALLFVSGGCGPRKNVLPSNDHQNSALSEESISDQMLKDKRYGKGALLLTRFQSLEELKEVVKIEYFDFVGRPNPLTGRSTMVRMTHSSENKTVTSILRTGVSQDDFTRARDGGLGSKIALALKSPYSIWVRKDLQRVHTLARWRSDLFQEGDVAFYDLAKTMMLHISEYDRIQMTERDLQDKGYINTMNHVTNQAMITSLFSERLADLIADAHERFSMPELMSGKFTPEQIADIETGPTDNYLDIINNEWGQELGKQLKEKYEICRCTKWTPELLSSYLNDIQNYASSAFQIGFKPFYEEEEVIIRFTQKLNRVMHDPSLF